MNYERKRKGIFNNLPKKTLRTTPSIKDVVPPDTASYYFNLEDHPDLYDQNDLYDDPNNQDHSNNQDNEQIDQLMLKIGKKLLIDEESINNLLMQNRTLVDNLNQLKKMVNNLTEDVFKVNDRVIKQDKKIAQLEREIEEQTFKFPASTASKCDRSPSYIN